MMVQFKRVGRREIYKGRVVNLVQDLLETPDGKVVNWDLIIHNGASAIIPVDADGKIIMVRQYRNAADLEMLEIPAGKLEEGEDPYECARRELEEETGYASDDVEFLIDFYPAIGYSNEKIYVYVATNLKETIQALDEDEFVEVEKYSLDEILEKIMDGTINDSKTITAIFAYKNKYNL
jgi:ADP-ribose pyrophosphatase